MIRLTHFEQLEILINNPKQKLLPTNQCLPSGIISEKNDKHV